MFNYKFRNLVVQLSVLFIFLTIAIIMFFVHFGLGLLVFIPTVFVANNCFLSSMEDDIDWLNLKRIFHFRLTFKEMIIQRVLNIKQDDWNIKWNEKCEQFELQHGIFKITASGWDTKMYVKIDGKYELLTVMANDDDDTIFKKMYRENDDSKWISMVKNLDLNN